MKIRKATENDLREIQKLNKKLFDREFEKHDGDLNVNWPFQEEGEKYFRNMIENHFVYVADTGDKVVGYLAGLVREDKTLMLSHVELDNMFVEKDWRAKGIGSELVSEFKKYALNKGVEKMIVSAYAGNERAIEFYKKVGMSNLSVTLFCRLG